MHLITNNPKRAVAEMISGYVKSHPDLLEETEHPRVLRVKEVPVQKRVGVVSAGGTGHFPAFIGYVRPYFLDAVACGDIFEAPSGEMIWEAVKSADRGCGVIIIIGNYALDNRCAFKAKQLAEQAGIPVEVVVATDDVATAGKKEGTAKGRGLAGECLLWKIAGTASREGKKLSEIAAICREANERIRSIGLALSPCTIPEMDAPKFEVVEGTMEVGIGHHGDPGISTYKVRPASKIADLMLKEVLRTYDTTQKNEVIVLLSGLGSTIQMELYIVYNRIADVLKKNHITVRKAYVGNYFTSLDMHGLSITLLNCTDELEHLVTAYTTDFMQ